MPVRSRTRHEFPRNPPKADSMFAKHDSGEKPHRALLDYATRVSAPVKPKRSNTKTLHR